MPIEFSHTSGPRKWVGHIPEGVRNLFLGVQRYMLKTRRPALVRDLARTLDLAPSQVLRMLMRATEIDVVATWAPRIFANNETGEVVDLGRPPHQFYIVSQISGVEADQMYLEAAVGEIMRTVIVNYYSGSPQKYGEGDTYVPQLDDVQPQLNDGFDVGLPPGTI